VKIFISYSFLIFILSNSSTTGGILLTSHNLTASGGTHLTISQLVLLSTSKPKEAKSKKE
jgi:hypothetical protein